MTTSGHYGFLQRWSRRKEQARESHPYGDAALPHAPGADAPAAGSSTADPAEPTAAPGGTVPPEPPALTLDDVRALTPESDFAP
ncbi:MAG TPA: DUF3306 domain-containing protein, partial [Bordetella sp.]|nr:DUF3306 domain-containing protein [Bordetella sp.]